MIAHLRGTVVEDGVVETRDGVGYAVSTVKPLAAGTSVSLYVHTQMRDSDITLWGFSTRDERAVFLALTAVQGVGPSIAMAILRSLGIDELVAAVAEADAAAFKPVPGVGAALAKRIVATVNLPAGARDLARRAPRHVVEEAARTLKQLGYPGPAVDEELKQLAAGSPDMSAGDMVVDAVRRLASGGGA